MELSEINVNKTQKGILAKRGIYTIEDLLVKLMPSKYMDFRQPHKIGELQNGMVCSVVGKMISHKVNTEKIYTKAVIEDETGKMDIIWFSDVYTSRLLCDGQFYIFCGTISVDPKWGKSMSNPEAFSTDINKYRILMPKYPNIPNINVQHRVEQSLEVCHFEDNLSETYKREFNLYSTEDMVKRGHRPRNTDDIIQSQRRLVFDYVYDFAKNMYLKSLKNRTDSNYIIRATTITEQFEKSLPYELTNDQKNTYLEITDKIKKGKRINAIIQGDVGCGKTITAIMLMLSIAENGYQSALIAPTGMLAKQHFDKLTEMLNGLGFPIVYLDGDTKGKKRENVLNKIKFGEAKLIVGTHAVLTDSVEFNNLALFIIDEEHRFGVEQKEKLMKYAFMGIHSVYMSATLIPRTIGMSLYGNMMDIYSITTMPPGRTPIKTALGDKNLSYRGIRYAVTQGHQVYVVCPLIDDNPKMEAQSVKNCYEEMQSVFNNDNISIGMINGKMKNAEIEAIKQQFVEGNLDILISTTIVEVGIDVPNATVIVIKGADRFGLFQLHQLRGRVGRGKYPGFCLLETGNNIKETARNRLESFVRTNNGFEITQLELQSKGSGEFFGIKQSGENKALFLAMKYKELYSKLLGMFEKGIE